jgi:phosphopantetheinyl transferase (holo-ACP synthase)
MIGNDIVDLDLANQESNWKRSGFLDKVFTDAEQRIILTYEVPEIMVWILWSMKEAAYKIYNRQEGTRAYIPLLLHCSELAVNDKIISGKVFFEESIFFTQTLVSQNCIDTVAVQNTTDFSRIKILDNFAQINRAKGLPDFYDKEKNEFRPVSISHHGRFQKAITI